MEDAVLHGQAVARVLLKLKAQGWRPDTILAHPGWGETLYAKDVFPDARLVHYCEWSHNAPPLDGLGEGLQDLTSLRLALGLSVGDDLMHGSDHARP
jgi:hypothetical protein